ncbi:double zinc ribbon and ankyrin repeat-containing protein 1 isoform X1 [Xiphophorus couchianus]|uniref:double zinc ribbon and ankyrin repeat-containing protein 1 isoform X1 n=1 Tax=Xiphophorus couchianus TaxID=32473 RepID=UPI0010164D84|nr:double zinc ribbon and ankyrin repeat-containing protein 1 isoform X1 [Xiphophorus couchianus]XP_027872264.1 double zinc ribbon and ankyrin repeat-containing protein 1 isoform X1 [Xiphophorus couchianus]XP_027872265.1 double zinc ribbon and ankyrin repeat-containing protein 1 isoform X1 [Xiphophorus couchianus]XP_027872266.1 double zinc ribbon and ankyrin repeat-containing protein 1 isoform X1 [Xiphophorus couchianus]
MAAGAISTPLIIPISEGVTRKPKTRIDTRTPVCIQSDSPGVLIFFTLDGSKPVAGQRGSEVGSRKYTGPVLLPAGRVSVRAVAVARDGRRSSVVTKVFSVGQAEPDQQVQSEGGYDSDERSGSDPTPEGPPGRSEWRKVTCSPASEPGRTGSSPPPVSLPSRCSRGAGIPDPDAAWTSSSRRSRSADSHHLAPLSCEPQTHRPRDAAAQRCPRCLCVCPSDPFARFCSQCGAVIPPVPTLRPPPAGRGQLLPCPSCRCLVPINSRTCWTCEASTEGTRAGFSLQVDLGGGGAPSGGPADGSMWSCSRCRRLNRHDARFCDRCGTKAGQAPCWVTCWRCGASAPLDAPHCAACGVFLLAMAPPTPCSDISPPEEDAAHSQAPPPQSPASRRGVAPPPVDRSTQTVGLYYPSATELQQRDQQRALWRRREAARSDPRPPLSAVSPGRGYWRNQLDHVCSHLRSYTQNRASFRTLLAEPRLGRMVSALVQQNQEEVVLTLSFSLAANQNRQQVGPDGDPDGRGPAGSSTVPGRVQTLSSVTQRATDGAGSPRRKRDADLEPDLLVSSGSDVTRLTSVGPAGGGPPRPGGYHGEWSP